MFDPRPADRRSTLATAIFVLTLLASLPARSEVWEVGNHLLTGLIGRGHTTPQANAHFGAVVRAADHYGDGIPDVFVSAPEYDDLVGDPQVPDAGFIDIYYSDDEDCCGGVRADGPFPDGFEARFGAALATGDFDADGRREVVIAYPTAWVGIADEAGGVRVSQFELDATGEYHLEFNELTLGVPGDPEPFDHFGQALAAGDFDGDGYADLAIGIPGENLELPASVLDAGAVTVLYSSLGSLSSLGAQSFDESVLGGAQANARFGSVLEAGNFDGDAYVDLAIGIPERDVVSGTLQSDAGQVVILFGSASGLTATGHQRISDNSIAAGERFGAALAAADFDFSLSCLFVNCYSDLAIGVPGQLDLGQPESGKVVVLEGGGSGLDTENRLHLYQDLLLDGGSMPEPYDHFGSVLEADFGELFRVDLVIGVPDEDLDGSSGTDQGMVHLVHGGASGLLAIPGQAVYARPGLASYPPADFDHFGAALAIGDLNGDWQPDLLVGIPDRNFPGALDGGAVQVLYGALFADSFESGGVGYWD